MVFFFYSGYKKYAYYLPTVKYYQKCLYTEIKPRIGASYVELDANLYYTIILLGVTKVTRFRIHQSRDAHYGIIKKFGASTVVIIIVDVFHEFGIMFIDFLGRQRRLHLWSSRCTARRSCSYRSFLPRKYVYFDDIKFDADNKEHIVFLKYCLAVWG